MILSLDLDRSRAVVDLPSTNVPLAHWGERTRRAIFVPLGLNVAVDGCRDGLISARASCW
jgi:hypothetical protein